LLGGFLFARPLALLGAFGTQKGPLDFLLASPLSLAPLTRNGSGFCVLWDFGN